jgi:RHS repeat-associated protein
LASGKIGSQTFGYTNNRTNGFNYDAAGNQTNDGLHNYTFSAENQMVSMDGGAATYAYDGEGQRMKRTVGSETTFYFYGPGGMLLCEFTTTNTGATQAASTDRTTYRTSDKLGSAVLIMNSSGMVIENNRTLPYGETWIPENTPSTNDKKFTTYQRDSESGLDYAMNRYYGNTTGRFASIDKGAAKLHRPVTFNRYLYTGSDPINHSDPDGNEEENDPTPVPLSQARFSSIGGNDPRTYEMVGIGEPQATGTNDLGHLTAARKRAIDALNENADCRAIYGPEAIGAFDPAEVLDSILNNGRYGQIKIERLDDDEAAVTTPVYQSVRNPLTLTFGRVTIKVNSTYLGRDLNEDANTLLHELGHALYFLGARGAEFRQNDRSAANQEFNNNLINEKCLGIKKED